MTENELQSLTVVKENIKQECQSSVSIDQTKKCCGCVHVLKSSKQSTKARHHSKADDLEYGVDDNPALYMCFVFGLQQVLLAISSTISIPLIVSERICAGDLELVKSEIMNTFLFMCGVCTVLQCLFGVRLPIIQGGCHKFIPAITALMALDKWKCPPEIQTVTGFLSNTTSVNGTSELREPAVDLTEVWQSRMREIQGGIILASLTQIFIGCTGLLGVILQYIGPITIMPTITLVGLSLIDVSNRFCGSHWGIAAFTICLVLLFSLYLRNVTIPVPAWSKGKDCHFTAFPIFKLLPVILAICIAWSVSGLCTVTGVFTSNTTLPEFRARTDARLTVVTNAQWIFFPYPGQWGKPSVSIAGYMGMLAATMTSIIESVGDYYACARISGVPPPPAHAVNRGIAVEGIGSVLSGLVGSGGATTSYSQNVGAIGFTKVASRRVFICAGVIFMLCGIVGKLGAILVTLPDPVLGGVVVISFGMVTSVGLSTLQFVNLSSTRNLCIIGTATLLGLMVPDYLSNHPNAIDTGVPDLDQAIKVLLSTAMFVGGIIAFLLDNTVPGTSEERGVIKWRQETLAAVINESDTSSEQGDNDDTSVVKSSTYDYPMITSHLKRISCCKYIPFCPTFKYMQVRKSSCSSIKNGELMTGIMGKLDADIVDEKRTNV